MKNKIKIIFLVISCIAFIYLVGASTIGRYIYNGINNYILESKGFYLKSTVLSPNQANYSINNWDGVNPYTLTIDVSNKKNDSIYTTSDIEYDITVNCSSNVTCSLNKTSGVIYSLQHTDSYTIVVTPIDNFYAGDSTVVTTEITSSTPYEKSLSAKYTIGVANSEFSYKIEDSVGSKYFTLELTNAISYYVATEAFAGYQMGDHISLEAYNNLSSENKNKCFSALVNISFDPNTVLLDITDNTYLEKKPNSLTTTQINSYDYVNGYQFSMEANSNEKIIFYKKDTNQNYTYPIVNNNSIIGVNVTTAN